MSEDHDETDTAPDSRGWGPDSAEPVGAIIADRYSLHHIVGEGGMGQVFAGEHVALGLPVAVKLLHRAVAKDDESVRRLRHEGLALRQITHPHVVKVLDFGEHEGRFYLVMEYVEGRSLGSRIDDSELLPIAEVIRVAAQIADALQAVHDAGVVHRDLKPDNVLFTDRRSEALEIKLVDFGLAHVESPLDLETLTQTGSFAGTPQYMSPEQCRSLKVGPATDLYALGCLITEMLQRAPVFRAATPIDIITKQLFSPPPPLRRPEGAEPVPELLERLRVQLLAKLPEQRPASAKEVRDRLLALEDPQRVAELLPARSGAHLTGRAERSPTWRPDARDAAELATHRGVVALVTTTGLALDESVVTALEAHGLSAVRCAPDALPPNAVSVVLDVGDDVDRAHEWLRSEKPPTVVCVRTPSIAALRSLIAEGAAAVHAHPVDASRLVRTLQGVTRRASRS